MKIKPLNESKKLKEGWSHFEFTSGANPYIAITDDAVKGIKRRHGEYVAYIGNIDGNDYYIVDDRREDRDLFSVDEELEWNTYKITYIRDNGKEDSTTFKTWQSDVAYAWRKSPQNIPHTKIKSIELVETIDESKHLNETTYGKDELWAYINNYEWAYRTLADAVERGVEKGYKKDAIVNMVAREIYKMKDDFGRLPTTRAERLELARDFVEDELPADYMPDKKEETVTEAFKPKADGIQSVKVYNQYNYTIQELRIDNDKKTFERGNFTMGKPDKKTKNRQEFEDVVDELKKLGYEEIPSDYHSLRNKTRKGVSTNEEYLVDNKEIKEEVRRLMTQLEKDGFENKDNFDRAVGSTYYAIFRKIVGAKGVWKAIRYSETDKPEIIDVTYAQARGDEPLDSFDDLQRSLGRALLPKNESMKEAYCSSDSVSRMLTNYVTTIDGVTGLDPKRIKELPRNYRLTSSSLLGGRVYDHGTILCNGITFVFRVRDNGTVKVMTSTQAGSNWSETIFKESMKEECKAFGAKAKKLQMSEASYGKNYRKSWSDDGSVYSQTYYISNDEYQKVLKAIEDYKDRDYGNDNVYGSYDSLKKRLTAKDGEIFPGLTAARLVRDVLRLENFKLDRNVRFVINDKKANASMNESKSLKEKHSDVSLDDILSWLQDHEQAWDDFWAHFEDVDYKDLTQDMVVGWISEHEQLYDDFVDYFGEDEFLNESKSNNDDGIFKKAVEMLYRMNEFVLDVYDNESWLVYGVPDGEFEEDTVEEAIMNYKDHLWLVEDLETNSFSEDDFRDFIDAFKSATRSRDYDKSERELIVKESEELLV